MNQMDHEWINGRNFEFILGELSNIKECGFLCGTALWLPKSRFKIPYLKILAFTSFFFSVNDHKASTSLEYARLRTNVTLDIRSLSNSDPAPFPVSVNVHTILASGLAQTLFGLFAWKVLILQPCLALCMQERNA